MGINPTSRPFVNNPGHGAEHLVGLWATQQGPLLSRPGTTAHLRELPAAHFHMASACKPNVSGHMCLQRACGRPGSWHMLDRHAFLPFLQVSNCEAGQAS